MTDSILRTAAEQLSDEARSRVDRIMQTTPPLHGAATDGEIASYLCHTRDALSALLPWKDTVTDQLETVAILRVIVRLHEMHGFHVDKDSGEDTLWSLLSRYRTCQDRVVASLASLLFSRLCAQQISDTSPLQSDGRGLIWETLSGIPPPPPSPSYASPSHRRFTYSSF